MNEDLKNYKWGIFYYNPDDNRVFVPKRLKALGWTLNFANPYSYLVILGIIVFAFIMGNINRILKWIIRIYTIGNTE